MRQKLEEYRALAERSQALNKPPRDDYSLHSELRKGEYAVKQILRALEPGLEQFDLDSWTPELEAKAAVDRGLGVLADQEEIAARLIPDAPTLLADRLHPWVWDSARTLWESRHYRQAVQAAATSLNAKVQDNVNRRDVSDDKLIQEAFGQNEPEPGKPRLRVPGVLTDESVRSRQRGVLQLGLACTWAIRNPATHDDEEWEEQLALERLAALSVFARLVDECEVVRL